MLQDEKNTFYYNIDDMFKKGETVVMTESVFVPHSLMDHSHEYLEIAYIKDGVGEHILNGKRHSVRKGDVFFIGRNSVHNYNALSPNFHWINCLFLPKALSADAFTCDNAKDVVKLAIFANISEIQKITAESIELQPQIDEFGSIFDEMLKEYVENKPGSQEILRHYLSLLCIKLFRRYASINESGKNDEEMNYAKLVIECLEKNSFENFDLNEIAKKVFLSPRYFQTVFKKHTGKSLTNFLHEVRIERACKLLTETDLSVNAIMQSVGYNDTKFFYHIFKRHTGLTPGNYRTRFPSEP